MTNAELLSSPASVAFTPVQTGAGDSFGGEAILIIGPFAIPFGKGVLQASAAAEAARRWNAGLATRYVR